MHEPTIQEVLANAEVLTGPPVTAWRVPARLVPVGAAVWTHGAFREVLSNEETDTITSRRALQLAGAPGTELPGECGMVKGPNDVVLVEAEPAPVRVPEDGAAPGIGESRMCRCGHSHSWHQKNGRCGQVSDEWSGGCLCREFRPAPVPEDGAEGALPAPCGNCGRPRWECACDVGEVRVPVEARDHASHPSEKDGLNPRQLSSNPEQLPPAPVSEEPEGGDLMANLERSLERARAAKKRPPAPSPEAE